MSRETIVTCDLCKAIIKDDEQHWNVLLYATASYQPHPENSPHTPWLRLEICRPCLDRLGIAVRNKKPEELHAPVPTIEDMIRELVANAVEELK